MPNRRDFLKYSALMMGSVLLPNALSSTTKYALASSPFSSNSETWLDDYITALDRPQYAPLNDIFDDLLPDNVNLTIMVHDVLRGQLLSGIKTESPFPTASAFKGPLVFFFMDVVDESVWNSVPVQYWKARDFSEVPEEYHDAWAQHNSILNSLYRSTVLSENNPTGWAFVYLANVVGTDYPLAAFNDWSHNVVGISTLSHVGKWAYGIPPNGRISIVDDRYLERKASIDYQLVQFNNMMTSRDLGYYYLWWQSRMSPAARQVGQDLLSAIENERRSNLERIAFDYGGLSYTKNGSLSVQETGIAPVVTDGGLIYLPDYGLYLVSFLSGMADSRTPDYFTRIREVVTGVYDERIRAWVNPADQDRRQQEHATLFMETMYPETVALLPDAFNYGFIKHEGVELFYEPDASKPIRNPVISASRFGVHLVMQGALIRFKPINDVWAELIPDSADDNVKNKLSARIYLRLRDLHPIHSDRASLIPYFSVPDVKAMEKQVIINIGQRNLTLLERGQPVLKTPMVVHDIDTPRGGHTVLTRWLSCSMQPWAPGVPFTSYFHDGGFAIHGSPWQRWEQTVNQGNVFQRTSAGCVNIPNWPVRIGDYFAPLDELIFRWLGGAANPDRNVYEYGTFEHPTVWVYVIDQLTDLYDYFMSPEMRAQYIPWEDIVNRVNAAEMIAPNSFFEL